MRPFTLHLSVLELLHVANEVENFLVLVLTPAVRFALLHVKLHAESNLSEWIMQAPSPGAGEHPVLNRLVVCSREGLLL